jgi:hypothetical protein
MVHPLCWLIAGLTAPKLYEKLSPEDKNYLKEKFGMHHGEVGILMILGGALSRNHGLSAFGVGLVIDDWKDRDKWFKKKYSDVD